MSEFKPLDPTACGLFFVAAISLPLAIGQLVNDASVVPLLPSADAFIVIGICILVIALLAYLAGSNFGFTVFALVGAAVALTGFGMGPVENITFALLYFIAIIWSIKIGTPKALTVICFTTGLIFLTVGLAGIVGGDYWHWAIGISALLNFIFNLYLSVTLALERPAW